MSVVINVGFRNGVIDILRTHRILGMVGMKKSKIPQDELLQLFFLAIFDDVGMVRIAGDQCGDALSVLRPLVGAEKDGCRIQVIVDVVRRVDGRPNGKI